VIVIDFAISRAEAQRRLATLTPRQTQIAERMAMGKTRIQIAEQLGISVRTFDIHLYKTQRKLGVPTIYGIGRIWFAALLGR